MNKTFLPVFLCLVLAGCIGIREDKVYDAPAVEASARALVATLVVPGESVGGVPFSITRKELFAMLGTPDRMFFEGRRIDSDVPAIDVYCVYASRGISILFHGEEVRSVSWTSESYSTREGLRVGSPVADATALWGSYVRKWTVAGRNLLAFAGPYVIVETDRDLRTILGMGLLSPSWAQATGAGLWSQIDLAPSDMIEDRMAQEAEERRQNAALLSVAGIDLDAYESGYGSAERYGYVTYSYVLRESKTGDVRTQAETMVAAMDSILARMPSAAEVVKEFGRPPVIHIATSGSARFLNLYYGAASSNSGPPPIQLYYGNRSIGLTEMRLYAAVDGYSFRGKLEVGSTFDEVFEVMGQPLDRVMGKDTDWRDRVFSEADLGSGYRRQYISYATEGARFFGTDGSVTCIYLFDPKGSFAAGMLQYSASQAQPAACKP